MNGARGSPPVRSSKSPVTINVVESADGNNAASSGLTVTKRKYADLVPVALEAPASGRGGDTMTVRWTVANKGESSTGNQWTDRLVLSSDAIYGNADDVVLVTAAHFGALAPGESYTQERQVVLPQMASLESTRRSVH